MSEREEEEAEAEVAADAVAGAEEGADQGPQTTLALPAVKGARGAEATIKPRVYPPYPNLRHRHRPAVHNLRPPTSNPLHLVVGEEDVIAEERTFGGHLSSQAVAESQTADQSPSPAPPPAPTGLFADAPEFVPGRPSEGHRTTGRPPQPARRPSKKQTKSTAPDLPTRIHEDIDNHQYECVICTEEVTRTTEVWACGLCWAVLHRECVRLWHNQETAKVDPRRDEGTGSRPWKCPACNSRLNEGVDRYHCWCGKDHKPQSVKGIPPHSCGQSCSKPRQTCPHPCALTCHAGPCPPCSTTIPNLSCYCGKAAQTKRCLDTAADDGWSCGDTCDDFLSCGEHQCSRPCHTGLCGACVLPVNARCYCGKSVKEMPCEDRGDKQESFNHGQAVETSLADAAESVGSWFIGSFQYCNETKPCAEKITLTCECLRLKKYGKCGASDSKPNPTPPTLECDDECARLKRVAQLREAFNIGPDHTDEHVPYSDATLDMFQENQSWSVEQESELRDFASDATKRIHRFSPMPPASRAFIHSLAKDFGLNSESQDQGANRSVTVFKSHTFVSAPLKSLATSLRIRTLKVEKEAEAKALERAALRPDPVNFNAIVLSAPSFGLTAEDLEAALAKDLDHVSIVFAIDFRPQGEVVLRASTRTFADALHPANVREALEALKPGVARTVAKEGLAGGVYLAHVDGELNITRQERTTGQGGWSEVVRRGKGAGASGDSTPPAGGEEPERTTGRVKLRLGMGRVSLGMRRGLDKPRVDWVASLREEDME
ncbi:uncharacterized protein DNG_00520 [Cephalotrichum gorgonifer]|uniref:R3H domain-containing protein n=1 Tax=Cephalotrichum gorgonifer TaxID=2041049 RepID=A0AAE8MQH6_9PEZI|nr:uncharacterized protein DNG_00520 [Cephalotrichum gorgonifer]